MYFRQLAEMFFTHDETVTNKSFFRIASGLHLYEFLANLRYCKSPMLLIQFDETGQYRMTDTKSYFDNFNISFWILAQLKANDAEAKEQWQETLYDLEKLIITKLRTDYQNRIFYSDLNITYTPVNNIGDNYHGKKYTFTIRSPFCA